MKLAKKILACVIALALVSCFAVTAFAAGKVDVKVTASQAIVGETVKVTVKFSNTVGMAVGQALLNFNKEVLSIDPENDVEASSDGMFVTGFVTGKDDVISIGYMNPNAAKADTLEVVFTFEVIAEGKLGLDLVDFEAGDADENDITGSVDVSAVKDLEAKNKEEDTTPSKKDDTSSTDAPKPTSKTPDTGDAGIASLSVAAGLVALAGAAFVISKKKK